MYAKLFSSITESSLWSEPKEVRLLFVTMIAKADAVGFVEASLPGLARIANLTLDETSVALEVLKSPDKYSKNPDNEGRRIIEVPGGYMLLNYEGYRARRSEEERREYMRDYMKEYRQGVRKLSVNNRKQILDDVNRGKLPLAQAEAEAEAEAEAKKNTKRAAPCVSKPDSVEQQAWDDWMAVRKSKKAGVPTASVIRSIQTEAAKAGMSLGQAIKCAAENEWRGFKAEWLTAEIAAASKVPTAEDLKGWNP